MPDVTMQDAINAGDGTLHGAIDYWQNRCAELEEKLKVAEEALTCAYEVLDPCTPYDRLAMDKVFAALAKINYFVWAPGSQSVSVEHLEMVVHAARAEALREAAKSIESVDPFSFAIELLRDKANVEENQ